MGTQIMTDDFDWSDRDCVVVKSQDAVAVYANNDGDLVIRRERSWNEEDDTLIVISRQHVRRIIEAMERVLKETSG
jgi:hypothetical protein